MEKIVEATYDGEAFRPNEPINLATDTKVKVIIGENSGGLELLEVPKKEKGEPYSFFKFARSLNLDGPSDFSINLDDDLYHGKPLNDEE